MGGLKTVHKHLHLATISFAPDQKEEDDSRLYCTVNALWLSTASWIAEGLDAKTTYNEKMQYSDLQCKKMCLKLAVVCTLGIFKVVWPNIWSN